MDLPVMPPVKPMLAKSAAQIPDLGHTEPKWDGFRTIVFRDGDEVILGSRTEKPLTRYFPELVDALKERLPDRCVLDGEIIVATDERLDFEALQQRIHPAASRVALLAEETPAAFVAFDMLATGADDLMAAPFIERRKKLEEALGGDGGGGSIFLTPATADLDTARDWFTRLEGAGLDGVVAKPLDGTYQPDKRTMIKIKHERTADCVVAGYRLHKTSTADRPLLGSLLLGLYDSNNRLQHVGVAASFTAARRAELIAELRPLESGTGDHPWSGWDDWAVANPDRVPGTRSRWSQGKDLSFVPLRPQIVVEVAYEHMQGSRFRHTAQFRRWRPDRDPRTCTYEQLECPVDLRLSDLLGR